MDVSAFVGTVSAPFAAGPAGLDLARIVRSLFSLALAVGVLAFALPVAFGSSGVQGRGVDPVQIFSSSSVLAPEASGGAALSAAGLVPGASREATIRVSNPGAAASFSLAARISDGGSALARTLHLRIESPRNGTVLYSGSLTSMPRLQLGRIGAGGAQAYRFTVALPQAAGNAVQGSSLRAGFAWTAS